MKRGCKMSLGHSKPEEWLRANPKTSGENLIGRPGEVALPLGRDKDRGKALLGGDTEVPGPKFHKHIRDEQEQHRNTEHSCGTQHFAKIPSPQNVSALLTGHEFPFANGACGVVCAESLHPPEFTSQMTLSWLIQAVGREEMDVQNPNRISELMKVEEAWCSSTELSMACSPRGKNKTCLMCTQHNPLQHLELVWLRKVFPCPKWDGTETFWLSPVVWYWKSLVLDSLDTKEFSWILNDWTVVSQAKQEAVLLSKIATVSSAAPHLPLKWHFIAISPHVQWAPWVIPKLRTLNVILNHRDLIKEWPTGQSPILGVCQILNGPIQTHLLERTQGPAGLGLQILLFLCSTRFVMLTLLPAQRNRDSKPFKGYKPFKEYEQTKKSLSPLATEHLQCSCTRLPECSN